MLLEIVSRWSNYVHSKQTHSWITLSVPLSFTDWLQPAERFYIEIVYLETKLIDETQFSNPKSFDYNFDDDVRKPVDRNDIYDELVPLLPTFTLHKNGKDVGRTKVYIQFIIYFYSIHFIIFKITDFSLKK